MYKVFLFNKALVFVSPEELAALDQGVSYFHFSDQADLLHRYRGLVHDGNEQRSLFVVASDPQQVWELFAGGFENVLAAGGVVKDPYDRTLFILRHNRWDLPKGKVEDGEEIAQAAKREVEEECGVEVHRQEGHLMNSYHIYQAKGIEFLKKTVWYRMRVDEPQEPEPQVEEGITRVEWKGPEEEKEVERNTFASILQVIRAARSEAVQ